MVLSLRRRDLIASGIGGLLLVAGVVAYFRLSHQVQRALDISSKQVTALQFAALGMPPIQFERWGGGEVEAAVATSSTLITAGGFGVADETGDLSAGLPSIKVTALTLWRGRPVAGLASGGLFLRRDGHWEEARIGFGALHVRALQEGPGGELLIGAREGLFRVAWGASVIERLDPAPVRSIAMGESGLLLAGGEEGLRQIEGLRSNLLPTPDPWVDWVGLQGKDVVVLTPAGLARGPLGSPLVPLLDGREASSGAQREDQIYVVSGERLLRFDPSGTTSEERLPVPPMRIFSSVGLLFADTRNGLYRKTPNGWQLARRRAASLPPGSSHVNALATFHGRVAVGLFDGGLVMGESRGPDLNWRSVPGTAAWGVNALLPAGGVLYIASLRGAARFDGRRIDPIEAGGSGSAHSLALTRDGVAIGFGQGVLLPDSRLLSAFHGLPGNQALALASGDHLFVGTPSGLGAVSGSRVVWRTTAGDGKLPHPWITALALFKDSLYVGTYGGGVTRRPKPAGKDESVGAFDSFLETQGLKVNQGCLVEAAGRLFLGTDGAGLHRLDAEGNRFIPVKVSLPSPRVTALLQDRDWLYVGTDEGLTRLPLSMLREGN